jgi:hypothetical protein
VFKLSIFSVPGYSGSKILRYSRNLFQEIVQRVFRIVKILQYSRDYSVIPEIVKFCSIQRLFRGIKFCGIQNCSELSKFCEYSRDYSELFKNYSVVNFTRYSGIIQMIEIVKFKYSKIVRDCQILRYSRVFRCFQRLFQRL